MKQEKAIGRRITARGGLERSGHIADELRLLQRGGARGGVSNVGSPVLGWGNGCYDVAEDVMAELWAE